jgi:hypothetical protein
LPYLLDSVHVRTGEVDEDISHDVVPKFAQVNFVLAEKVELEDCGALLR